MCAEVRSVDVSVLKDVIAREGRQVREVVLHLPNVPDRAQLNDEVSVRERKRARNREYNRVYRERKKMKILAGETVHVAPDVAERRRACVRERVKRYRERKKVKQSAMTGNVTFAGSSMHVFRRIARYTLFHHCNLRRN
jgi:hypothetical protein